jgi:hypothetical protein
MFKNVCITKDYNSSKKYFRSFLMLNFSRVFQFEDEEEKVERIFCSQHEIQIHVSAALIE